MEFEWDDHKNEVNKLKHKISFEEVIEIFYYPISKRPDNRFDYQETRYIGIGQNSQMIIFTVIYTERESRIRIISARRANKKERQIYYEYYT